MAYFDLVLMCAWSVRVTGSVQSCAYMQMEDEYMIRDSEIFVSKYISVPKEMGTLSCNAFMAGIIKGVLDGSGFPARCV